MQYGMTFITGAWRFINKIDVEYKKGPVPYIKYKIHGTGPFLYIWNGTLCVPYIYFIDKTSSSCAFIYYDIYVVTKVIFNYYRLSLFLDKKIVFGALFSHSLSFRGTDDIVISEEKPESGMQSAIRYFYHFLIFRNVT